MRGSSLASNPTTETLDESNPGRRVPAQVTFRLVELWDRRGVVSEAAWEISGPLTIGRYADVKINDPSASREHARVQPSRKPGLALVVDLGSHNGTWVNGVRVDRALVSVGDVVRIGRTLYTIDEVGAEPGRLAKDMGARAGAMLDLLSPLEKFAKSDTRVLLTGLPGVGKQVLAEALHRASEVEGPFVSVNCARLDRDTTDSEMFGHLKGAFTNAFRDRAGLIAQADGGTLFLDEIGELPLESQARLLSVLQDGVVRPLGADRGAPVEFRLICATNAVLEAAVAQGTFRADLYHRIAEWPVNLPPLSARTADSPAILAKLGHPRLERFTTREALVLASWPTNVRGLVYAARRLAMADTSPEPQRILFPGGMRGRPPAFVPPFSLPESAEELELLMATFEGNIAAAARHVDRSREIVYRMLTRFGLGDRN